MQSSSLANYISYSTLYQEKYDRHGHAGDHVARSIQDYLIFKLYSVAVSMKLSVYPPVKWEDMSDSVNRLPVDVAER